MLICRPQRSQSRIENSRDPFLIQFRMLGRNLKQFSPFKMEHIPLNGHLYSSRDDDQPMPTMRSSVVAYFQTTPYSMAEIFEIFSDRLVARCISDALLCAVFQQLAMALVQWLGWLGWLGGALLFGNLQLIGIQWYSYMNMDVCVVCNVVSRMIFHTKFLQKLHFDSFINFRKRIHTFAILTRTWLNLSSWGGVLRKRPMTTVEEGGTPWFMWI